MTPRVPRAREARRGSLRDRPDPSGIHCGCCGSVRDPRIRHGSTSAERHAGFESAQQRLERAPVREHPRAATCRGQEACLHPTDDRAFRPLRHSGCFGSRKQIVVVHARLVAHVVSMKWVQNSAKLGDPSGIDQIRQGSTVGVVDPSGILGSVHAERNRGDLVFRERVE